jgi:DNA-binding LacI/PurR family transcriptional regulator
MISWSRASPTASLCPPYSPLYSSQRSPVATALLAGRSFRRVATIVGTTGVPAAQDRLNGFRRRWPRQGYPIMLLLRAIAHRGTGAEHGGEGNQASYTDALLPSV